VCLKSGDLPLQPLIEIIFPVFALIAIGYVAARYGVFGDQGVTTLTNATFVIFMPPLLFRTMASMSFTGLRGDTLYAYFSSALLLLFMVIAGSRLLRHSYDQAIVQGLSVTFSNTVLIGIPLIKLAFGDPGLTVLLPIIAVHSIVLLTLTTLMLELTRAVHLDASGNEVSVLRIVAQAFRNAVIHPVVLPILAGLAWGATGFGLHTTVDKTLNLLGQAGPPASLVLLGASLGQFGINGRWRSAIMTSALKNLLHPGLAYVISFWGFGLRGVPLAVIVVTAALPAGANVYLFAQRYQTGLANASAAIAVSTAISVVTLSLLLPYFAR
jgi:malonate transporter and related proteins